MTSDLSNARRKDDDATSAAMMLSMAGGIHKNNNDDDENHENDGGNNENVLHSGVAGETSSSSSSVSNAIRAAAANSSAQTRFSFYDAQEVHLQFASSGNPTLTSQEQQQQKQSAKNNKNNSAGKMEAQRFTFHTTDLASNNNGDDEDGDQFYTPTAGRTGLGSSSNPIKTHTPSHSNPTNVVSKDGTRSGGVRTTTTTTTSSRTSHKKRTSHHNAAREELVAVDNLPGLGAIDSSGSADEILRSLQETEEQRLQLLKAVTPSEDMVRKLHQNGGKGSNITTNNHNASTKSNSTRRPMSVAATTLVQGGGSTTTTKGTKASNGLSSSLGGATPSVVDTSGGTSHYAATTANDNSNPYEDAIKEALDLLRRHRSPSGGIGTPRDAAQTLLDTAAGTGTGPLQLLSPRSRALRPRTPRENDRVLQSRLDEDDDQIMVEEEVGATSDPVASYEEAKLKAKQRQERMAGYASRLQEFKSSMPTEIGDTTTTTTTTAWQPRQPATSAIHSVEEVHPPAASTTNYTGATSGRHLQQPQPQLGMSPIPQHGSMDEVISDVSQSTRLRDDEIQRGVERVLLAILERANNSRSRGSQGGLSFSPNEQQQQDAADATIKAQLSEEALIHAMEELLGQVTSSSDSLGGVKSEPPIVARAVGGPVRGATTDLSTTQNSGGRVPQNEGGPPIATTTTTTIAGASRGVINTKRSAEKSVVDELLAEDEEDDPEYLILQQCISPSSTAVLAASPMYSRNNWTGHREEKKLPDTSELPQQRPNETSSSSKQDPQSGEGFSQIIGNCLESSNEEDDAVTADDDDDTARQGDSGDCIDDDEHDETYTDASDDEDGLIGSPSDKEGSLERVLGPLSKRGTTGVVLDLQNSPEIGQEEEEPPPVGESFSKVMKEAESVMSYVSSAMSPNVKAKQQLEQQVQKRSTVDEKYSAEDEDHLEDDEEAKELMRTLCAHLLPFGVDQSKQLVEIVPAWDETNPNEAGYRIIRLSKAQLRRVEGAFESMINSLKRDSERQLNKLELATINGYDATFVKELQEAEKLLDDEERRVSQVAAEEQQRQQQQRFAGLLGLKKKPVEVKPLQPGALSLNDDDKESVTGEPTACHPDFPGVKTAGQGEMGDLEYFHLPIIFKSHVTGFEPTKDLVLEPGNVVAGQYLVESELGTAAFSTAYRCIDLSSDNENDVSGILLMV
jgi:hypothetical protein